MKRQVLLLLILGIISLTARGQSPAKTSDVQCDTMKTAGELKDAKRHPVNDYSGLNSLRARLANRSWDGHSDTTKVNKDSVYGKTPNENNSSSASADSSDGMKRRGEERTGPIGMSLLVFFNGGGTQMKEQFQTINIHNAAQLAKEYGFRIRVTGSADSATGSPERNDTVARSRAEFIADLLVKDGIPEDSIEIQSIGGVNSCVPASANRNCKIELLL